MRQIIITVIILGLMSGAAEAKKAKYDARLTNNGIQYVPIPTIAGTRKAKEPKAPYGIYKDGRLTGMKYKITR